MGTLRTNFKAAVIGLDIGGTKTAAGIVLFPEGKLLNRRVIPTRPERPGRVVLHDIVALATELARESAALGHPATGIGAGVAELVDRHGGVTSSQTIDWKGLTVRGSLSQLLLRLSNPMSALPLWEKPCSAQAELSTVLSTLRSARE